MNRARNPLVFVAIVVAIVLTFIAAAFALDEWTAEKTSEPDKPLPPISAVPGPGQFEGINEAGVLYEFQVATWESAVVEVEARREADRLAAAPSSPGAGIPAALAGVCGVGGGTLDAIPMHAIERESGPGGDYCAFNPTGCGGFTCLGAYQFDARHFGEWGTCAGLDLSPSGQDECARRIYDGGRGCGAWNIC